MKSALAKKNNPKFTEISREYLADKNQIPVLKEFLNESLLKWKIDETKRGDIILAADEAATNIIMHAYGCENLKDCQPKTGDTTSVKFKLVIRKSASLLQIVLEDEGISCDVTKVKLPDIKTYLNQQRRGGFGIALMRVLMDKISFHCKNGKNFTKLVKKI